MKRQFASQARRGLLGAAFAGIALTVALPAAEASQVAGNTIGAVGTSPARGNSKITVTSVSVPKAKASSAGVPAKAASSAGKN